MKPGDLLLVVERVRRATSNGDIVTICDALSARLVVEMTVRAIEPPTAAELATGLVIRKDGKRVDARDVFVPGAPVVDGALAATMQRTAMDAVVEHAESGRKPARGKAKRAIARKAWKGKR